MASLLFLTKISNGISFTNVSVALHSDSLGPSFLSKLICTCVKIVLLVDYWLMKVKHQVT